VASINETLLVLIPKVEKADDLGQYRPISLCNIIYKIASKVVANRLKRILPQIIAEEQSAFVPDRLITDNIITAYECVHSMKQKKSSGCCALKLDMRRHLTRLNGATYRPLLRLGFHQPMVMRLVSSVSFSVLFNGECLNKFSPLRGIRYGILSLLIYFC
jgi:hypothetical protein